VIRKKKACFSILLFFVLLMLVIHGCSTPSPPDPGLKVTEVAFSDTWDKEDKDIGTPLRNHFLRIL